VIYHILKPLLFKYTWFYISHLIASLVFPFFIYSIFSLISFYNIKFSNLEKFKLERMWTLFYFLFLLLFYNGRVLDRFFIPIIIFITTPAIEGINIFIDWIDKKINEKKIKYIRRITFLTSFKDMVILFSL